VSRAGQDKVKASPLKIEGFPRGLSDFPFVWRALT